MVKGAWVTLATNDSYSLGALVLAHSLKQVGTQQELAILVTPGVTNSMRARLSDVFNIVREVNVLDSRDKANLRLLQRPELGITFTKLHCWQLTEYEKCVFLDADTLVLQNCDELFEREELSAAPDVGWPDCFNSGVFVYRPSEETYNSLIQFALDKGSFDGGDQGLLNLYFADWARKDISKHLPFIYNVCSTAFYSYLPAFKQFGKDVKIIHFIGNAKPWLQYFDTESKKVRPSRDLGHLEPILQRWWNIFCSMIHPNLSPDMSGLAGAFAKLTLGQQRTPEQEALEDTLRRQNWEQGNIDYLGKDSFDNIWSKICETLAKGPQEDEGVKDIDLASIQQETCAQPKEDVLSASQETTVTAEPNSSSSPSAELSENTPINSVVPLTEVPSESVPSVTTKTEENVPIPSEQTASDKSSPPKETQKPVAASVEEVPSEKVPSVAETSKSASLPVEQTQSDNLLPANEDSKTMIAPVPTEKTISELKCVLQPDKQAEVSASPVAEVLTTSQEVPKQDDATEKLLPTAQYISCGMEQAASSPQQISPEKLACTLKGVTPVEEIPGFETTSSTPSPQEIPVSENVSPAEQCSITEISSSAKTVAPTECSKSEKTSSENIIQPCEEKPAISSTQSSQAPSKLEETRSEIISQASCEEKVTPSSTQTAPMKEVPSQPKQVLSEEASLPKEGPPSQTQNTSSKPEQIPPKDISQPSEEKLSPSPTHTTSVKEVPSKPSPPKDVLPSPTQPESFKPEQVTPKEVSQPSEEIITPSPTKIEPTKVVPSKPEGPPTPVTVSQQVSVPASGDTTSSEPSNATATSPVVSSEPPPPITPPPRKSGGNKKQGKSKK